jgi:hypothetical protein
VILTLLITSLPLPFPSLSAGEMALPNLTEAMQRRQKESRQTWKFIKEKIPVLPLHERVAATLVGEINGASCAILWCAVQECAVLYKSVLCCAVLCCAIVCCDVM